MAAIFMGGGAWLFGIIQFAFTQFARSQIDTADTTREILELLKSERKIRGPVTPTVGATSNAPKRKEPRLSIND